MIQVNFKKPCQSHLLPKHFAVELSYLPYRLSRTALINIRPSACQSSFNLLPWRKFCCENMSSKRLWVTSLTWEKAMKLYIPFLIIISPWKRAWPFIWTNLNPHNPRIVWVKFGWNWPVVLEKKMKMWKVYDNIGGDNDGQRTNLDQKSSLEPSAQVS